MYNYPNFNSFTEHQANEAKIMLRAAVHQFIIQNSHTKAKTDDDKRCMSDGISDMRRIVVGTLWVVAASSILSIITQPPQPFQRRLCELAIRSRSVRAK